MPTSSITRMASGCTRLASVPALWTSRRSSARARRKPSAIWLRAALCVQRTRTRARAPPGNPAVNAPPLGTRRAARGRAARGVLRERQSGGAGPGCLVFEIVVEVVHLPLDPVGVPYPELVLIRVATVDADLLAHRQPARLHAGQLLHDARRRVHLDSDVIHCPVAPGPSGRQRQVDRRPLGQELEVAGFLLDRRAAEESLVEVPAFPQIRRVHVQMNLGAHGTLPSLYISKFIEI